MTKTPPLNNAYKSNFNELLRAADNGQLCLVSAIRKSDQQPVALVCAVNKVGEEFEITPFAVMCEGNPYEDFEDPTLEEKSEDTTQPDKEFHSQHKEAIDALEGRVEQALRDNGHKIHHVRYAAYQCDDSQIPVDNLDQVAINGRARVVLTRDGVHGGSYDADFRSPILVDPTWLDLAVQANKAIETTKDEHHCFFEDIKFLKMSRGVATYELLMGS